MLKFKRLVVPCLLLAALMLMLAGCGGEPAVTPDAPAPAPEPEVEVVEEEEGIFVGGELVASRELYDAAVAEGQVVLYTAQVADHEQRLADGFMAQFPEIQVEILRLAGHRLHERVETEWAARQMDADFIVQSEGTYLFDYAKRGLMLENFPPSDALYPDELKTPGYVYPITMSPMIIQYNSEIIAKEDAPKDWPDLLDPKYKGLVGHTRGGGGSPYVMFMTMTDLFGWDILEGLAANESVIFTGGAGVTTSLISGEIHVGALGVMSSYPQKVHMRAPIEYVYPESGAAPYVAFGGIPATAPNPNAAKLFMNWYFSNVGQARISGIRGTYSYHPDVLPPPGVPNLDQIKMHAPDMEKLYYDMDYREAFDNRWNETMQYFE